MLICQGGFGKRLLVRCLVFVMTLLIAIMPIMIPAAQAVLIEGVVAYGAVELIAKVLIGAGITFGAVEVARSVAGQVYGWLQDNKGNIADLFANWARIYTGDLTNAGIRVSGAVVDAVKQAVNALFGKTDTGFTATTWDNATVLEISEFTVSLHDRINEVFAAYNIKDFKINNNMYSLRVLPVSFDGLSGLGFYVNGELMFENRFANDYWNLHDVRFSFANVTQSSGGYFSVSAQISHPGREPFWTGGYEPSGLNDYSNAILKNKPFTLTIPAVTSFTGDIAYPSDDYIVKVPDLPDVVTDADGKELVVYPELPLNPADNLADIPIAETGEKVDVPYDTLVDTTTGEQIDVGNPDIPDIPDVKPGIGQGILDKLKDFFDSPSDFHLNFDGFKNMILPDRFPFCIPFDLINSIKVFSAAAADFHFRIDLDTKYWSVHHEVDLTPFSVPIAFFRYICVIWFSWILITRTRDMIKW